MPTTGTMKYLQIGDATYEIYNTDQKVSQSYKAASGYTYWRPLLIGYSSGSAANFTPSDQTDLSYTFETLKVQPSTGTIRFGAAALTNSGYTNTVSAGTLTANRTLTAPDKSGTIAVTSDLHNVPSGGSSGQVLSKASGTDYDLEWTTVSSGGGTVTSVGLTNATNGGLTISGSPITSSGSITVGHSNVLTSAQTTQAVYPIKIDKNGHINAYGTAVSIPTKVSDLTNDAGYLISYTETDPTVPSWAKASDKPEYYATEIAVEAPVDDDYNNVQEALAGLINGKANTSHAHGNITSGGDITATAPTIASGDQLIINDHSVSKITNGPTFDGSTTNKYLSPKGTWESLPQSTAYTAGTGLSLSGTEFNHSNSVTAQTTQAVYPIKIDAQGHIASYGSAVTIPSITLNGTSTTSPSFYAPTTAGTDGYYLKSNGSGAPTWATAPAGVYFAEYNVTSYQDIKNAIDAGKEVILIDTTTWASSDIIKYLNLDWSNFDSGDVITFVCSDNTYWIQVSTSGGTDVWDKDELTYWSLPFGDGLHKITFTPPLNIGTDKTINVPNQSGTLALTSDIPTVPTKTSDLTNDSGFVTTDEKVKVGAASNSTIYYPVIGGNGATAETKKYSSAYTFEQDSNYAELAIGDNTRTGDIALGGGNNYYAFLQPTTLTTNRLFTLPDKDGTIALTSDIPTVPTKVSDLTNDSGFVTSTVTGTTLVIN